MTESEFSAETFAPLSPEPERTGAESAAPTSLESLAFEAELRRALHPVEVPLGFADRIVASAAHTQAQASRRAKVLPFRGWRLATGGALAASLLAGTVVFEEVHQRGERERAAALANQQFETATRITDEALERTREQLRRAGVPAIE